MKKSTFPRLIPWMFLTALTFLIFMSIARYVFFIHFKPLDDVFSNYLNVFLLGLRFDLRTVCGLILFPFLIGNLHLRYNEKNRLKIQSIITLILTVALMFVLLLFMKKGHATEVVLIPMGLLFSLIIAWLFITKNCNPFENKTSARIFKIYFLVASILLVLFYVIDFQHFDYLHQRLNASVINYTEDAKISANMVWETYPVWSMLAIIIFGSAALYFLVIRYYKSIKTRIFKGGMSFKIVAGVAFTLLLGLGLFGKLNQYPLRWSDAFTFKDDFKANLALNPLQSFLSTMQFRNSSFDLNKVKDDYPLMAKYLNITNPDAGTLNYNRIHLNNGETHTPNVVVVICESYSSYKSGVGGNPLNTSPYFDELSENGILFDRCFTPAYGTARGVWATITGIPDVEYPNTSSRNPAYVNQHSIIADYKNYEKLYFIGGSSSWANIRGLLTNNIPGLDLYEEENFKSEANDVWGISDKRLFMESNAILKKQTKPFFAVIQTADNHRPYTIPEEDKATFILENHPEDTLKKYGFQSNDELNAFRYMDYAIKTFIESAKKEAYFENTIFVFIGDHGIKGDAGALFPQAWEAQGLTSYHVPLLFYGPALVKPARFHNTCSQLDLLPSVSALANISFINSTLGKNLFDTLSPDVRFKNNAFIFDPGIKSIGMVTDEYSYTHNLLSGKQEYYSSKDNLPLANTPAVAEDKKALKILTGAYYETARYLLYNNKKENSAK
jgi:phosphoglycerol transferase MdoB-like AlkP superfamily enzyme